MQIPQYVRKKQMMFTRLWIILRNKHMLTPVIACYKSLCVYKYVRTIVLNINERKITKAARNRSDGHRPY